MDWGLARDLAKDPNRHVILTTATPHSGIEEGFRSLLGLLNPNFDSSEDADLPKAELTPHLIQRKRADLKRWLDVDTPFPERQAVERSYRMSADYHRLYQDILNYCREHVASKGMAEQRQRVRYATGQPCPSCGACSPVRSLEAARAALENRRSSRDGLQPRAIRTLCDVLNSTPKNCSSPAPWTWYDVCGVLYLLKSGVPVANAARGNWRT